MAHQMIKKFNRDELIIALFALPLYIAAAGRYGLKVFAMLCVSILVGWTIEKYAFLLTGKKVKRLGLAAWILFPLVFPPAFPLWMLGASVAFGALIGVVFFGGNGNEIASPVAMGWAFGALSFPREYGFGWVYPFSDMFKGFEHYLGGTITVDHPLIFIRSRNVETLDIMAGAFPQPLGMALPWLLVICGLIVLLLRAVDFKSVVSFFVTVFILQAIYSYMAGTAYGLNDLLAGNLILAGLFIFPQRQVTPRTQNGRIITGIMTGVIAVMIRNFSSFPDGVFFAILFGNVFSALIDDQLLNYKYSKIKEGV